MSPNPLILAILDSYAIIARIIPRRLHSQLHDLLSEYPAVALIGPRQVGKTTLAWQIADATDSVYLDLEPSDLPKLSDPELYLADHQHRLVILDKCIGHRAFSKHFAASSIGEDAPGEEWAVSSAGVCLDGAIAAIA